MHILVYDLNTTRPSQNVLLVVTECKKIILRQIAFICAQLQHQGAEERAGVSGEADGIIIG